MPTLYKNKQKRNKYDFYPTPANFVDASLSMVSVTPTSVLDPSVGWGAWSLAVFNRWGCFVDAYDIQDVPERFHFRCFHQQNYLEATNKNKYDLICTNPPYSLAQQFVEKAITELAAGGECVMLLRLAFLESKTRFPMWQSTPLKHVKVFSNRPSFTADGKTDASAYGAFLWKEGFLGQPTISWEIV